jgi:glycosyltransferase involved in cell wall biosynthesis
MDLTLVIPCYREASHIRKSFPELIDALGRTTLSWEVLLIDDCSPDNTVEELDKLVRSHPSSRFIQNQNNLGRGATVAKGFRMSEATVVGFIDIDLSTQPLYIPHLAGLILDDKADVATCHRSYKIEVAVLHRIWHRYLLSYGYRALSRLYLDHPLHDTETGCKFFRRERIIPILDRIHDPRWFWDTEIMVYSWLAGLRIKEVQSIFIRRPEKPSTVRVLHDVQQYLRNLKSLKKKLRVERQDQQ